MATIMVCTTQVSSIKKKKVLYAQVQVFHVKKSCCGIMRDHRSLLLVANISPCALAMDQFLASALEL